MPFIDSSRSATHFTLSRPAQRTIPVTIQIDWSSPEHHGSPVFGLVEQEQRGAGSAHARVASGHCNTVLGHGPHLHIGQFVGHFRHLLAGAVHHGNMEILDQPVHSGHFHGPLLHSLHLHPLHVGQVDLPQLDVPGGAVRSNGLRYGLRVHSGHYWLRQVRWLAGWLASQKPRASWVPSSNRVIMGNERPGQCAPVLALLIGSTIIGLDIHCPTATAATMMR